MSEDYIVRSADWLAGYAAGREAGWKAALAERETPTDCQWPGCRRLALTHPRYCRTHRYVEDTDG